MIGYLALPAHWAKVMLVVAPFMSDEARVPLDRLLNDGYEVKSATGSQDVVLFLQKGAQLYSCQVPGTVLATGLQPGGEIPAQQILCAPFR